MRIVPTDRLAHATAGSTVDLHRGAFHSGSFGPAASVPRAVSSIDPGQHALNQIWLWTCTILISRQASSRPLGRNELVLRPDGRSMAVQWYLVSGDQRRRNTIHEYRIHEYCIHHTVYSAPLLARRHRQHSLTLLRFDHLLSQCSLGHNTPHFSSPRPRPFSPDPRTKVATPAPYRHRNVFMIT